MTKGSRWFDRMTRALEGNPAYERTGHMIDVTSEICKAAAEQGLAMASLAKKAGVSKASLDTLLGDYENAKVETLMRVQEVLGLLPKARTRGVTRRRAVAV